MDTSRIHQELLRRQPNNTTSTGAMDLEPGQPVFVKEVNGNIWRTATVDQPAAEPDSYWVRFPDDSILRRTRSVIRPGSLPSHFELQAEAQQRNFEGETNSCSSESFSQLNEQSMLPVTPMASVTHPATVNRGSKVSETPDPINSTGAPSPQVREEPFSVFLLFPDIQLDLQKVFLQFAILHPGSEWITVTFMCASFAVEIGLLACLSFKRVRTCETWTMWITFLTFSAYSKFYSIDI